MTNGRTNGKERKEEKESEAERRQTQCSDLPGLSFGACCLRRFLFFMMRRWSEALRARSTHAAVRATSSGPPRASHRALATPKTYSDHHARMLEAAFSRVPGSKRPA